MQPIQAEEPHSLTLPDAITAFWARDFGKELEQATWRGGDALRRLLAADVVLKILYMANMHLKAEPTLLEVNCSSLKYA